MRLAQWILVPVIRSRRSQHLIIFLFSAVIVKNKTELPNTWDSSAPCNCSEIPPALADPWSAELLCSSEVSLVALVDCNNAYEWVRSWTPGLVGWWTPSTWGLLVSVETIEFEGIVPFLLWIKDLKGFLCGALGSPSAPEGLWLGNGLDLLQLFS